jgi:MtN3 and saliva related transmembrane protein
MDFGTVVGLIAAGCTTFSSVPQLKKCWRTGSAGDLSLRMVLIHSAGVGLWVGYGFIRNDWIIIVANTISLLLYAGLLYFKLREKPSAAPVIS